MAIFEDVRQKLQKFVPESVTDAAGNKIFRALAPAFGRLTPERLRAFLEYLHALRTIALDAHDGREFGMSPDNARAIVARPIPYPKKLFKTA